MAELGYRTLRENIVDIIRKRIIRREFEPGKKIVEQELAKEFKTSRAPIREALRQLENEGRIRKKCRLFSKRDITGRIF